MVFRKASAADVSAVEEIYNDIHTEEEKGKLTIGWIRWNGIQWLGRCTGSWDTRKWASWTRSCRACPT